MEEIWQFVKDNAAPLSAAAAVAMVLITVVTVFFRSLTTAGASLLKHLKGKEKKAREAGGDGAPLAQGGVAPAVAAGLPFLVCDNVYTKDR